MHRIDAAGHTLDYKFTDGNPATATPATVVDAKWLNMVQEEIITVIAAAGITLDDGDETQLYDAIMALILANVPTIPDASTTVKGKVELATNTEASDGVDTVRAVTPAGVKGAIDARVASDTAAGLVEFATSAETITGSATDRAVTPAGLAALTSSDTRAGLVELATNAEVQTGTDTARAVTPAGLASQTSTDTRRGLIEIATAAETQTGTDPDRAVTPAGLASVVASTSAKGLVELATTAETQAGADTTRAITPAGLKAAHGFSKYFDSGELSIAGAGSRTQISHGLGVVPLFAHCTLVCAVAELGYAVGDEIPLTQWIFPSSQNYSSTFHYNNTSCSLTIGSSGLYLSSVDGVNYGNRAVITYANWRLRFKAFA